MSETLEQRGEKLMESLLIGMPYIARPEIVKALRRERELAVRACHTAARQAMTRQGIDIHTANGIGRAILAVAKPAAPVWCEHMKPCDYHEERAHWQCRDKDGISNAASDWTRCPICGAPRPEVQP